MVREECPHRLGWVTVDVDDAGYVTVLCATCQLFERVFPPVTEGVRR